MTQLSNLSPTLSKKREALLDAFLIESNSNEMPGERGVVGYRTDTSVWFPCGDWKNASRLTSGLHGENWFSAEGLSVFRS
jgi:hypothetical protein